MGKTGGSIAIFMSFVVACLACPAPGSVVELMVNGTFEEVFLLGVLVRGLRAHGLPFAIGVSLLVRVLYHLYQGPLGAVWVLSIGLMLTLFYVRGKQLWPPVLAHILWDIVPVVAATA